MGDCNKLVASVFHFLALLISSAGGTFCFENIAKAIDLLWIRALEFFVF